MGVNAEKDFKDNSYQRTQNAKKSLDSYIDQLELHFDLDEKAVYNILKSTLQTRKNKKLKKKWWQIW